MDNAYTMICTLTLATLLSGPAAVTAADRWQERMLFEPSVAQLELEQGRDRVMIYHGLTDGQVAQAMDRQFDRIEHMMFTGTVVTDAQGEAETDPGSGSVVVEDDGC